MVFYYNSGEEWGGGCTIASQSQIKFGDGCSVGNPLFS